jgi:hypothetical protein
MNRPARHENNPDRLPHGEHDMLDAPLRVLRIVAWVAAVVAAVNVYLPAFEDSQIPILRTIARWVARPYAFDPEVGDTVFTAERITAVVSIETIVVVAVILGLNRFRRSRAKTA